MRTARLLTVVGGVSPGGVYPEGVWVTRGVCVHVCVCVWLGGVHTLGSRGTPPPEQNGRQV